MDGDNDPAGESEYGNLANALDIDRISRFAVSVHAAQRHFDGTSKVSHVYAVSAALAVKYAQICFLDLPKLEKRYTETVCPAAGLLHETMLNGKDFEAVSEEADEAVARLVAAVTPDARAARPKRYQLFGNAIGLANKASAGGSISRSAARRRGLQGDAAKADAALFRDQRCRLRA